MYPEKIVRGRIEFLEELGATSLESRSSVSEAIRTGLQLVVVNSICGCASTVLYPALEETLPVDFDVLTVFAGQHAEATEAMRERFEGYPPSSPCVALLQDGEVVEMCPRHEIIGADPEQVSRTVETWISTYT